MTENELGLLLKQMYDTASKNEKAAHIHLFGIKYAKDIVGYKLSVAEIVKISGISASYQTEVSKGMKLSKYVVLK